MTDSQGQSISWLEWRAQQTGKTVEEVREEMRSRGRKTKNNFANRSKEERQRISQLGVEARRNGKKT